MVRRVRLDGGATAIRPLALSDLDEMTALVARNREHLAPWDPIRPERWWTREGQADQLRRDVAAWDAGVGFAFAVLDREEGDRIVGRQALANVVRGPWRNATLGWWTSVDATGKGHATSAARLVLRFAFEVAGLHRVQPAVIPRNARSIRVAEKAGFRREGRALRYLEIAGAWEDHDIFAMTAEEWPGPLEGPPS
ncbi:GNAT family N-acetyltransferase [Conexibacter sp. SYSU D00693]|uniref:GNAT family N-acetyltransferase n=1 Tax=Conexibacter sp. SYSU D00693 TaxID=2812560 RepID=UPI00196AF9FA|nr:GNAT family protein [Conexibacter sp. SYSU D00693]